MERDSHLKPYDKVINSNIRKAPRSGRFYNGIHTAEQELSELSQGFSKCSSVILILYWRIVVSAFPGWFLHWHLHWHWHWFWFWLKSQALRFQHTASSQLSFLLDRSNLQLRPVLLQDILSVVFPELFRRVLSGHALENLGAAWVFVDELCPGWKKDISILGFVERKRRRGRKHGTTFGPCVYDSYGTHSLVTS